MLKENEVHTWEIWKSRLAADEAGACHCGGSLGSASSESSASSGACAEERCRHDSGFQLEMARYSFRVDVCFAWGRNRGEKCKHHTISPIATSRPRTAGINIPSHHFASPAHRDRVDDNKLVDDVRSRCPSIAVAVVPVAMSYYDIDAILTDAQVYPQTPVPMT